jgi:hypothetical protein
LPTAAKACCAKGRSSEGEEVGLVDDGHIVAEIGEVLRAGWWAELGTNYGRKSLGHVVQDLASAWALYQEPASCLPVDVRCGPAPLARLQGGLPAVVDALD